MSEQSEEELALLTSSNGGVQGEVEASLLLQVVLCSACFVVLLGVPFANKYLFKELVPHLPGSAALTPTVLMLFGATLLLGLASLVHMRLARRSCALQLSSRHLALFALPALAFAAVMGLTNTSLSLTSVNLHVLVRTSMLIFCVLFALLIEGERPSLLALLSCALLLAGVVCASWDAQSSLAVGVAAAPALVLTVLSAVAQGLLLVLTRRSARLLGRHASLELAACKCAILLFCFLVLLLLITL
jgi:drug/metabolite transporter (DMT)-like permease